MCVVRWFQDQEGPSTCPFCRREAGRLDNVPLVEEGEGSDDGDEDEDEDDDGEWEDDEEEDEEIGDLRAVWTRNEQGGFWERTWVVTGGAVMIWDPSAVVGEGEEAEEPPEEMVEGAVALQRIWRGWSVRRHLRPPPARDEEDVVARILVTLQAAAAAEPVNNWHYQRFVRVD